MKKLRTILMVMFAVLCSVVAMNLVQECNVMAAENLFEMTEGGSIRIAAPYGLRFQVKMDANIAKNADKVGMLIFPADYLVNDGTYGDVYYESVEIIASSRRIDLDLTPKLYEKDGYWYGNGAIVNIKENNMSREFVGIAYYEMNGKTVWADTSKLAITTRSASQVALLTQADKTNEYPTDTEKLLLNYIDYLKEADVDEAAPTRFQVRGYAADNGLRFYVTQYVNHVVKTGDKLTEQTHLEAEISQEKIGANGNGTYYKFWLDDTCEYDDTSSVKNVINEVTVTDRGKSFEGYRYKISYEIFIEFEENAGSTDEPYAYVQFKHYLPAETEEGLQYCFKEYRDNRYLWQDNCNAYELRSRGIMAKDIRYLETNEEYNKELFYQNQGTIQAADPCVITIGDTFYMYATNASDELDCSYIRVWSSKNLTDWIEVGKAFVPAEDAWAVGSLWAPEVICANGKYYMYYSGYNHTTSMMGVGVAVSNSPMGPFYEIEGTFGGKTYSRTEQPIDLGYPIIDPNPFIDDDGSVYLYVAQDQVNKKSSIYGCKLSSDMVTVEYVTEQPIVKPTVSQSASEDTKYWNEAPCMYKHEGKYYMIFSYGYYQSKSYSLGVSTSDKPLSGFEKISDNPILKAQNSWTYVSGTGHCSVFPSPDGTEFWVAYHSHIDVQNGGYQRKINFDRATFDTSERLVISGPSVTPQVLPSGVSDFGNVASEASVSATNGRDTSLLTDGIVNYRAGTKNKWIDEYEYNSTGNNTITFTFEETQKIRGIMIYDSADITAGGSSVGVTVGENSYKMILDSGSIPGTAAILEMNATEASVVTLTFNGNINLSEIVILAEKERSFDLTRNYFSEESQGVYTLTLNSAGDGGVDDLSRAGNVFREAYYSVKGKITLDTNADWTQARILISSDPNNEHMIAIERVDGTNYQIFAMSKQNEQSWNDWRLISHASLNGTRNYIDFEIIANGRQIYLLVDDVICYTSNRVSMIESTVKFSCAVNNQMEGASATTTVQNLEGQIFENEKAVKEYLAAKKEKTYETQYEARINELYQEYITDKGCVQRGGTLLLGHSHIDFWNNWEIQSGLTNYINGYNVGIGGTTTKDWLYAYDKLVKPFGADRFVISVGENDVTVWGEDGEAILERLELLFRKIHNDFPEAKIYYIYSLPSPTKYQNGIYVDAKYDALVKGEKKLCNNFKYVQGIDTFEVLATADRQNINADLFSTDGVHLNELGYQVWSDFLYDKIFKGAYFGASVGDGITYKTTNGINLINDSGENPTIDVIEGGPRYAYLNNSYTNKLYFETKINVKQVLNNDAWPKFGIIINGKTESLKFFVDMTAEMTATKVGVVHQPTNGDDDWANQVSTNVDNMKFTNEDKIKLAVARDGKAYYFYVNDVLVLTEENAFTDEKGAVGIFSFNTVLTASDYQILKGTHFGASVGDGITYKTTKGIDLANDSGENPTIDVIEGGPRYAYLNNAYTNKLYFETKINVKEVLNNDAWPKFGIIINGKTESLKFYVDMTAEMTATTVGVVHQPTNGDDDWSNQASTNVDNMKFTNEHKIKLAVVRDGKAYYFYVNDQLVLVEENAFTDENGAVGIFSFNTVMTASNYKFYKGADADSYIAVAKAAAGENFFGTANGLTTSPDVDLSKDFGANTGTVTVNTGNSKFMYARDFYEENYYFETKVHVNQVYNNDDWPKFGILVQDGAIQELFFVDMKPDKTSSTVGVVHDYDWDGSVSANVTGMNFSGEGEYVTLGLLKQGGTFTFSVNGNQALTYNSSLTGKTTVGVFGFNTGMTLKEYYVEIR